MSGDGEPDRIVERVAGFCFMAFLGAMALYGAVEIIASVWVPLCIGTAAISSLVGAWFLIRRGRDW